MRIPQRISARWLLCLALTLTLGGCATAKAPPKPTPTTSATATTILNGPAIVTSFVCADLAGSTATYAYVGPDKQMYLVHNCLQSAPIAAETGRRLTPIAFSPDGTWLLASDALIDNNITAPDFDCLALVATSTLVVTRTTLCNPNSVSGGWAQWYDVIAWEGANAFYLASTAGDLSVQVLRVAVPSLAQTFVTKLTWVASVANPSVAPSGIELRQNALYYGGYQSSSEGGAWLHRYDLVTGADTRFARLGLAGSGGCQVADVPCSWTGPWDVNADATRLAYHNPGPTQNISDTSTEPGQPLYDAALDGSNARRLFPLIPIGQGFSLPVFSPDGQYVSMSVNTPFVVERLSDGHVTPAPTSLAWAKWTPQPGVILCFDTGMISTAIQFDLWNVATGARTPLQTGSTDYVWA